jgi:hypothetical protein
MTYLATVKMLHGHAKDFQVLQRIVCRRLHRLSLDYQPPKPLHFLGIRIFIRLPHHRFLVCTIDFLRDMQCDRQTFHIRGIILQFLCFGRSVYFNVRIESRDVVNSRLVRDGKIWVSEENAENVRVLDSFYGPIAFGDHAVAYSSNKE